MKLDLTKDFFDLNSKELDELDRMRRAANYRYSGNRGHTVNRNFWYKLQREARRASTGSGTGLSSG